MIKGTIKIKDLKPAEYNPRQATKEQQEHLKNSLKKFGIVEPIIVNRNKERLNIIVGGHFRVRELKKLGYKEVDCVYVDLNLEEEKELNIRLNKNTGEFDFDILANEFEIGDLKDWGFDDIDFGFDEESEEEVEEDELPEVRKKPFVTKNDIWELNNHKMICGDATLIDDIEKLMGGEKADLCFTDPPYGMRKESEGIENDNLNYDKLLEFNKEWVINSFLQLKDNGSWYCWGTDEPLMDIYSDIIKPMIKENKVTFRNLITWDKGCGQGQNSDNARSYAIADEKCLFVMCGVQGFSNNKDSYFEGWEPIRSYLANEMERLNLKDKDIASLLGISRTGVSHWAKKGQWAFIPEKHYKVLQKEYGGFQKEYRILKEEYYSTRSYFDNKHDNFNNVWHFERVDGSQKQNAGGHCTPKPIALCSRAIKSSCPKKGLVIDLFLGSGSTLITCEQIERRCYGVEVQEKYCELVITRWLNYMIKENKDIILKCNGKEIDYKEILDS